MENIRKSKRKNRIISIRVTEDVYKFIKRNNIVPGKLFNNSINELVTNGRQR